MDTVTMRDLERILAGHTADPLTDWRRRVLTFLEDAHGESPLTRDAQQQALLSEYFHLTAGESQA
jgi:hypothetical protein